MIRKAVLLRSGKLQHSGSHHHGPNGPSSKEESRVRFRRGQLREEVVYGDVA
jgi:hypothetical protein